MKAVVWHGIGDPTDAVIRVGTAARCGNGPHRAS